MSTKNLARTVIEGGRAGYSKYLRRRSARDWRVASNRLCHQLAKDPESWDDCDIPSRPSNWDDIIHADKINPCKQFLASRAGQPWDKVRSEICKRFDRRTVAGRHVMFDHLIDYVVLDLATYSFGYKWKILSPRYWVDDQGILRHNPYRRY